MNSEEPKREELELDLTELQESIRVDSHGVDLDYSTMKDYAILEDPTDSLNSSFKIKFKDVVNYTADSCDYYKYEVEDVLRHFIMVLRWLIIDQKKDVYIRGLGTFKEKIINERIMFSPFTGKYYYVPTRSYISLATDKKILDHINPAAPQAVKTEVSEEEVLTKYAYIKIDKEQREEQQRIDRETYQPWNDTEAAVDLYARKKKYLKAKTAKKYAEKAKRKAERDKALREAQINYLERKVNERIASGPKIDES